MEAKACWRECGLYKCLVSKWGGKMKTTVDVMSVRSGWRGLKHSLLWIVGAIAVVLIALWLIVKYRSWVEFNHDLTTYQGVTIGETK